LQEAGLRNPIDSFTVPEADSADECWIGVYTVESEVLVAVSRKSDRDVEVSLREQDVRRLIAALESALDAVK
jgi:hypothetical protein